MNKSIVCFVACLLGLVACNVEHYEDCNPDDPLAGGDDFGGTHTGYAGSKASGGHSTGSGGSASTQAGTGSGATAATAGSSETSDGGDTQNDASGGVSGEAGAPPVAAPPTPCEKERDCAPGYNCNLEQHQCLPADQETCDELDTELACTNRKDCTPVYGGVNCSCGTNCECHGGEPGCVCESFQFFVCQDAP
jgi:hypothetical protein